MELGENEDIYLARVSWLPDGALLVQIENRGQTVLNLVRFDPSTGRGTPILRETSDIWINLHDAFHPMASSRYRGGFILSSERTGFRHLYFYDGQGKLLRALTAGDWMVHSCPR